MANTSEMSGLRNRKLHVFYVLDTSGSMTGVRIATLNAAMKETIAELKEQTKHKADADIKIAALGFANGCRWISNPDTPEDLEDFVWENQTANGMTDMGAALEELNDKLSKDKYLSSMTGQYIPVIIFMTDGNPTDNYKKPLEKLRQNKWFDRATKIGFAVGEDADREMIADIVGTPEAVISTDDMQEFAERLKFASVTATLVASQTVVEPDKKETDNPEPPVPDSKSTIPIWDSDGGFI